jgi:hypothetical protein
MRFIDTSQAKVLLGNSWHEDAEEARASVNSAPDSEARKAKIKAKAQLWSDAGKTLATLSSNRCWYCESRELRSDMPVDHFRPKNRVEEEKVRVKLPGKNKHTWQYPHEGYWWLAFSASNYRYSCTFCNSRRVDVVGGTDGGKQDHFPLLPGSTRAKCEADNHDLEKPALLDPCVEHDPELLTFLDSGRPLPSRSQEQDPIAHERAVASIRLYHLDHASLVAERKQLWARVNALVDRGSRIISRHGPADPSLTDVKQDLRALIRRSSPLCRLSHLALRGRRDVEWVRDWLDEIETTL